jgi:hypothetical protein
MKYASSHHPLFRSGSGSWQPVDLSEKGPRHEILGIHDGVVSQD